MRGIVQRVGPESVAYLRWGPRMRSRSVDDSKPIKRDSNQQFQPFGFTSVPSDKPKSPISAKCQGQAVEPPIQAPLAAGYRLLLAMAPPDLEPEFHSPRLVRHRPVFYILPTRILTHAPPATM